VVYTADHARCTRVINGRPWWVYNVFAKDYSNNIYLVKWQDARSRRSRSKLATT